MKEFHYSIEISVDKVLEEGEKTRLMVALSDAVAEALGKPKSGTVLIYSVPKEGGEKMQGI